MNHSGDANKMVSDTPRTTDRVVCIDGNPWVNAPFAGILERELNAANQRINELEAVVNDPHTLWTNWLRGDVKLPAGIGDVRQYQARIKRLEDCAETAWGIIANVDSGSWQEQRADWREAATRWRDEQFHPELSERKANEAKP